MTKQEFIDAYTARSEIEEYKTADGFHVPGIAHYVALPCACGEDDCPGWAMIPDELDNVAEHLRAYGPHPTPIF